MVVEVNEECGTVGKQVFELMLKGNEAEKERALWSFFTFPSLIPRKYLPQVGTKSSPGSRVRQKTRVPVVGPLITPSKFFPPRCGHLL